MNNGFCSCNAPTATSFRGIDLNSLKSEGLTQNGNTISTGRYDVIASEGKVVVFDTWTETTVKVFGDPHVRTSDGDRAQFHSDNLTLDLADGTKVTITPTEKNARGHSYVDTVSVMKGNDAARFTGISDNVPGVATNGVRHGAADLVDQLDTDGTVLRAGREVDDLTVVATGKELVGRDWSQWRGEHMLDGLGGESTFDFTKENDRFRSLLGGVSDNVARVVQSLQAGQSELSTATDSGKASEDLGSVMDSFRQSLATGDEEESGSEKKSIYAVIYASIARLENKLGDSEGGMVKDLKDLNLDSDKGRAKQAELLGEIQHIRQQIQQLTATATNLMKAEHNAHMSAISNLK